MSSTNNDKDNADRSERLWPYINTFRRRSTQIYQTIVLEPYHQPLFPVENTENSATSTNGISPPTIPSTQWKIYVLTTSITNYFCCGINMISSPMTCIQWLKSHFKSPLGILKAKLGGEEIGGIKVKLLFFLLDWTLDIGTAAYHFGNQRWIEATLTYLIVWGSGIITTVGFLRYPELRAYGTAKAKEVGILWLVLLYIPTFLPFVLLWLNTATDCEMTAADDEDPIKIKLVEEKDKLKDLSLKAFWLETVLESKPQALLQTLLLLERTDGFSNILDFLPVVQSLWSMYSMTNSIYELIVLNFKDETETYTKLYGNSYTVLSILVPVMIVNILRGPFTSNFDIFLATLIALLLYYAIFEVIYQIAYFISIYILNYKRRQAGTPEVENNHMDIRRHVTFSKLYQVVLLVLFSGCLISWDSLSQITSSGSVKRMIVISVFSLSLATNAVAFLKAEAFVVESFRLKNVKIDNSWKKVRTVMGNCFGRNRIVSIS